MLGKRGAQALTLNTGAQKHQTQIFEKTKFLEQFLETEFEKLFSEIFWSIALIHEYVFWLHERMKKIGTIQCRPSKVTVYQIFVTD